MDQLSLLESAVETQALTLAKGKVKAEEYEQTKQKLDQIILEKKQKLAKLHEDLSLPDQTSLKNLLFSLGPADTPVKNSLLALSFGLIPFLIFMILTSWSEDIWGPVNFSGFHDILFRTVGVPWGPIYLFFFGYFFKILWGNNGILKGLVFGGTLAVLYAFFSWLWLWDQVDGVELWGTSMRILVTFVFVGILMDWMTLQFSWKRIRLTHDSPAYTTIASVFATAVTTIVAAIMTGTLDRLLNIAIQGTTAAFGGQQVPLPGP